jgi:hypothetical protein
MSQLTFIYALPKANVNTGSTRALVWPAIARAHDLRSIEQLVFEHQEYLKKAFNEYHLR